MKTTFISILIKSIVLFHFNDSINSRKFKSKFLRYL